MTAESVVRRLLRKHGIRPRKRLGQHFLIDPAALSQVVGAAALEPGDSVLEIGAGLGALTVELARSAAEVMAVEVDHRLVGALREVVRGQPGVRIVEADILELDFEDLLGDRPYLVVANIPYNISSALIRRLTEADSSPKRIVLTIQRELAERAIAQPGQMSLLALTAQIYGAPSIQATVPPAAFYPQPQIDSAVLRIDKHPVKPIEAQQAAVVFALARAGFSQRRKMLKNAMAAGLRLAPAVVAEALEQAGVEAKARAQELSLEDWVRLAKALGDRIGGAQRRDRRLQ